MEGESPSGASVVLQTFTSRLNRNSLQCFGWYMWSFLKVFLTGTWYLSPISSEFWCYLLYFCYPVSWISQIPTKISRIARPSWKSDVFCYPVHTVLIYVIMVFNAVAVVIRSMNWAELECNASSSIFGKETLSTNMKKKYTFPLDSISSPAIATL